MIYQYVTDFNGGNNPNIILRNIDGIISCIPNDPTNRDWQEYQAWLAADPENNVPLAADEG